MADTAYTYNLTDTADDLLCEACLGTAVASSSTITTGHRSIGKISTTQFKVIMKASLDQTQEDALDALVAAHTGDHHHEDHPEALDGKPYVTPDIFTGGVSMQWMGAGDDPTLGRGMGPTFSADFSVKNEGTGGSTSAAATRTFTETGKFTDAEIGDKLVLSSGSDAGTYAVTEVVNANTVKIGEDWPVGGQSSISWEASGNKTIEWSHNDWIELAGGVCHCKGGEIGDWVTMCVHAHASVVEHNADDEGNCTLYDTLTGEAVTRWDSGTEYAADKLAIDSSGNIWKSLQTNTNQAQSEGAYWTAYLAPASGYYMILPSASVGTHDIDLTDDAIPIPTKVRPTDSPSGYWEWSWPDSGRGVVSAGSSPGNSSYNLYTFAIELAKYANRKTFLGDECNTLVVPAIKPRRLFPHWKISCTVHNHDGHADLQFCWSLMFGRMATV